MPHLRGSLGISDRALLPFTGLLVMRPRSMVGLERVVSGYFGVRAEVVPFRGRWQTFEDADVTRIGTTGQHQLLGRDAMVGTRVWDPEASFELRLGPMPLKQFLDFLPRRLCFRAASAIVRFYAGEELGVSYRLVLGAGEVPPLRIGRKQRALLGWTTWLQPRDVTRDDDQVSLAVSA